MTGALCVYVYIIMCLHIVRGLSLHTVLYGALNLDLTVKNIRAKAHE